MDSLQSFVNFGKNTDITLLNIPSVIFLSKHHVFLFLLFSAFLFFSVSALHISV